MSNGKEMVSITRETARQAVNLLAAHSTGPSLERDTAEELLDALEKPAEQHQREPVALPVKMKTIVQSDYANGWNACITLIETLGPLYTHADPGEVERLRAENEAFDADMRNLACQLSAGGYNAESLTADQLLEKVQWGLTHLTEAQARLVDSLRAKLADREVLLRGAAFLAERLKRSNLTMRREYLAELLGYLSDFSASAEPGAGAEHCESEEIGRVVYAGPNRKTVTIRCKLCGHHTIEHGHVIERRLQCCECGSKAFFILLPSEKLDPENNEAPPAGIDDLTDLATWKRRAIEAESKLRTYDPQVVELGEQAMQALLAEPKPNELVLTKCRLCDQLQADLTKRDQRIDQLEQQPRVPDGFALVPQSMLLSKEVIGVINFHCGDTDQEEGGQFGQYTDGRLWVGYVLDDDGNKVHGLHLATDEYPEEGSTTLIEFPEPGAQPEPEQCGACAGCASGCQVDKDSPKAEVMDISDLGADAVCGICYDTGHIIIDDTGPDYVTTPCTECEKGKQIEATATTPGAQVAALMESRGEP